MITKTDIEKYFLAEKQAGLLFICIGIIGIAIALAGFFIIKTNIWKGIAIPFVIFSIIQATIGYTVYSRSDEQRKTNVYALDMNPDKLTNTELPRMQKVNRNFTVVLAGELLLLAIAAWLMITYRNNAEKQMWYGIGIGLFIQCIVSLGADFMAERRAKIYTNALNTLRHT